MGGLKDEEESFFSLENLGLCFFLKQKCSHSSAKVKPLKLLVQNSI